MPERSQSFRTMKNLPLLLWGFQCARDTSLQKMEWSLESLHLLL